MFWYLSFLEIIIIIIISQQNLVSLLKKFDVCECQKGSVCEEAVMPLRALGLLLGLLGNMEYAIYMPCCIHGSRYFHDHLLFMDFEKSRLMFAWKLMRRSIRL